MKKENEGVKSPEEIPQEVMEKINAEAKEVAPYIDSPHLADEFIARYREGGMFGYRISQSRISELEKEVERLKKGYEEIIHTTASNAYTPFKKVARCYHVAALALNPISTEQLKTQTP